MPDAVKLDRKMIVHRDIFEAAMDDAARTLCEGLGVDYDDAAKAYWQTSEGDEMRITLQRFAAHVLLHQASNKRAA